MNSIDRSVAGVIKEDFGAGVLLVDTGWARDSDYIVQSLIIIVRRLSWRGRYVLNMLTVSYSLPSHFVEKAGIFFVRFWVKSFHEFVRLTPNHAPSKAVPRLPLWALELGWFGFLSFIYIIGRDYETLRVIDSSYLSGQESHFLNEWGDPVHLNQRLDVFLLRETRFGYLELLEAFVFTVTPWLSATHLQEAAADATATSEEHKGAVVQRKLLSLLEFCLKSIFLCGTLH